MNAGYSGNILSRITARLLNVGCMLPVCSMLNASYSMLEILNVTSRRTSEELKTTSQISGTTLAKLLSYLYYLYMYIRMYVHVLVISPE
jgi:uncharacterized membrane protein (GlpM family)